MARTVAEIAAEAEALRAAEGGDDDVVTDEGEGDDTVATQPASKFMSYEEYVKAGKDPDLYKGKKAFDEMHDLVKSLKDSKKDFRELAQTVNSTMEEWRTKEHATIKAQLEADLKQQRADGLVDEALETKGELDKLKAAEKKGQAPQLPPVITDYIEDTPLIDIESKEFNKDFFDDFKLVYDAEIHSLTKGTGMGLSDRQIKRALQSSYDRAKELNPELFPPSRSPRNDRPGMGRNGAGAKGGDGKGASIESRLKAMKFGDNRNTEQNPHPAYATYMSMKDKNPKAAERFARSILEESN